VTTVGGPERDEKRKGGGTARRERLQERGERIGREGGRLPEGRGGREEFAGGKRGALGGRKKVFSFLDGFMEIVREKYFFALAVFVVSTSVSANRSGSLSELPGEILSEAAVSVRRLVW
jgi:hypothetical protein